jgi:glyoxylase-like metal-dependent hydrolase (beta-lactamase superfamily II)
MILAVMLVACGKQAGDDAKPANTASKVTYPPVTVKVKAVRVSRHAWYIPGMTGTATEHNGFISNAGFVVTSAGVVVFDALGTPSLAHEMLKQIRKITDKPIVKVIVSHYHADHIYGLQVFKAEGAEIIAPAGAQKYIDSSQAKERLEERQLSLDPWVNEKTRVVKPDRYIDKDYKFRLGGVDFYISVLGEAHSDGDMTMYVATDRVLFSGDIIFEGRIAYVGDANTKNWLKILKRMELDKVVALIPGHGPAAKNPGHAISATREYLQFLREKMKAAVDELTPFDEAYSAIDWSRFSKLPAFEAANRRNAYQVYLSIEAEQLKEQQD